MAYSGVRRNAFLSYYRGDQPQVDSFVERWDKTEGVFTSWALGVGPDYDLIDGSNPEDVMSKIRRDYIGDSTVTIVLLGSCTHSRRYVDWEIKASLRQGDYTPNGLLGIILPNQSNPELPPRFAENWQPGQQNCYARLQTDPSSPEELAGWIEDAYTARQARPHFIRNSQDMMGYNRACEVHGVIH